jgi:hypothetical protein
MYHGCAHSARFFAEMLNFRSGDRVALSVMLRHFALKGVWRQLNSAVHDFGNVESFLSEFVKAAAN